MKNHHLLLTGATGSLGKILLPQLLREPSVECIHVLLRKMPEQPLPARVIPVIGDLRAGSLGLTPGHHQLLKQNITGILHAAADTRFDATYRDSYATNAAGTDNLLRFAAACGNLDRFVHLSTLCAAGKQTGRLREVPFKNKKGFVNQYEFTKSAAEFLVNEYSAILPTSILRMGTVIGHEDGRIHQAGALHRALRLMYASLVPMMPARPHCPVDLLSVEYATQAIAKLTCDRFSPGIYHLTAGCEYLPLDEMLNLAFDAFGRNRPAWRRRAIERPAIVDFATFDLFRRTVEETGAPGLAGSLRLLSSFAPQLLHPKTYDDTQCRRALAGTGIVRPNLRDFFPDIVASLITSPTPGIVRQYQEAA